MTVSAAKDHICRLVQIGYVLTNCFEFGYYEMKILDIVYNKELKVIHLL